MGTPVLKRYGRYFILDSLSKGGMAEVFRARRIDPSAANQILAIKQISDSFAEDESFLMMFKDEITTTMGLNHPNIVQLHDYGIQDNKPFIVMEFIFGVSLRDLITAMNPKGLPSQMACAAYIVEQVAAGLHYAHTFKDRLSGKPLKIVHRDITPRNIVISYDGVVKIIDFGVAKTTINTEQTKTGVIKGNLAYLSPELVAGDEPDARSDIFSLGLTFWELLTGARFFKTEGMTEFGIFKQIESCDRQYRAPSELNPGIPKALDALVAHAIQRDPDKRYESAEAFQFAIRRFLHKTYPDFNASVARQILDQMFTKQRQTERDYLRMLNGQAEEILKHLPASGSPPPGPGPFKSDKTLVLQQQPKTQVTRSPQTSPSLATFLAAKLNLGRFVALALVGVIALSSVKKSELARNSASFATTVPAVTHTAPASLVPARMPATAPSPRPSKKTKATGKKHPAHTKKKTSHG